MAELSIALRALFGKKVRQLRQSGFVPGEVYGHGAENRHVQVPVKDLARTYKESGAHAIVTLVDEKTKERIPALIAEIQSDPVSRRILSVDFHQIRMDEKIQITIPLHFTGEAPALKKGFVIIRVLDEIEVEALPTAIPDHFDVDLGKLAEEGQSLHIQDLNIPQEGVKVLIPSDTVVATVSDRAAEEEEVSQPASEESPESSERGSKEAEANEAGTENAEK